MHIIAFTSLVETIGTKIGKTIKIAIRQWVKRSDACEQIQSYFSSRFDHPHILAGQGSLGLEVLDQVPDVDAIVIPTG